MQVDQLIARVRSRIATMQTTAEEYEIEARFHADKALDLRLGVMELNQLITSVQEFVDGEPDDLPASPQVAPVEEAATAEVGPATTGEACPPETSPVTDSAAPVSVDATTDPAKLVAEEPSSDGSGEVQDRCESTSPPDSAAAPTDETGTASSSEPIPMYSRAGPIGAWVRGDEKALDPAPVGEAATSPAPTMRERVKQLHDAHPEYTRKQAWEALGITEGSLAGHGHALGIRWAPSPAAPKAKPTEPPPEPSPVQFKPGSTGDRVRIVHEQHPNWTARMIADHLGALEKTVANVLGELRRQAKAEPPREFSGKAEMVGHYSDVAKRLGKV